MKELKKILNLEKSVQEMIDELKVQISKEVSENPMDGVKPVGKNVVIVNSAALQNFILSPSYYIQSSQAEVVERKLRQFKTATDFVNELQKMVREKKVKIGKESHNLNPKTIEVLKKYSENI